MLFILTTCNRINFSLNPKVKWMFEKDVKSKQFLLIFNWKFFIKEILVKRINMLSWINIVKRPLFSPAKNLYIYIYSKLKNLSDKSRTVKKIFFNLEKSYYHRNLFQVNPYHF